MAYLYRHIRLDKNEPFYIGIGSDEYKNHERAYSKFCRNKYWKYITNNTPYEVEIMLEDLTWEEACEKEIEFIRLYGRDDLKEGSLVNMTNGGDGFKGPKTLEHRQKLGKNSPIGPQPNRRVPKPKLQGRTSPNLGKKHNNIVQIECPHCNKIGNKSIMTRWHFDNCKNI
jgi:hypothetical protein